MYICVVILTEIDWKYNFKKNFWYQQFYFYFNIGEQTKSVSSNNPFGFILCFTVEGLEIVLIFLFNELVPQPMFALQD